MKKFLGLLLITAGLVAGCAQRQYQPTQAEVQATDIKEKLDKGSDSFNKCIDGIQDNKSVQLINKEVLYGGVDGDKLKITLMTSNSKINPQQKSALLTYIDLRNYCNLQAKDTLKEFPTLLATREKYINSLDLIYVKLINQEISIATANREKLTSFETFKSDYATALQAMQDRLSVERNEELRRRQNANIAQGMAMQNMINSMPKSTNCTTSYVGNQAYTNCY